MWCNLINKCSKVTNKKYSNSIQFNKVIHCKTKSTFRTNSVTEIERNLAMLVKSIHFPLPAEGGFWGLLFLILGSGVLRTSSRSHINSCNFGSPEMKLNPSLSSDLRRLSLISPIDKDSTAPWEREKLQILRHAKHDDEHN